MLNQRFAKKQREFTVERNRRVDEKVAEAHEEHTFKAYPKHHWLGKPEPRDLMRKGFTVKQNPFAIRMWR